MRSILYMALLAAIKSVDGLCVLCESGVDGLKRPNYFVDVHGTTCAKKMLTIASSVDESSQQCNSEISQYREMCCGMTEPTQIGQIATKHPGTLIEYTGPYPVCEICRDKTVSENEEVYIRIGFIASPTEFFQFELSQNTAQVSFPTSNGS
jgi:hypothetical protein